MKHSVLITSLFLIFLPFAAVSQDWNELVRTADRLYNQGKYGDAAEFYEKAWRVKTQKRELIFLAGECYYLVKDYRRAADCYQFVRRENEDFHLVGLKYARSLKQDGRYREAIEEFKWFARDYKGPGKDMLDKIIVNDVRGCELGIELATTRKPKELPVEVQILPEWVNSPESEAAPVAFSDEVLYFTSGVGGRARLFRTNREDGAWQSPVEPQGLPELGKEAFGNGAFSPDGTRFYYTQCTTLKSEKTGTSNVKTRCEIFVIRKKEGKGWSAPERLRDYVNMPGTTTAHPFVWHEAGAEHLFFSSDREDGEGGTDLYACHRPLESDDLDFSFPQNLGEKINTGGDEITPVFDPATQTLFFSSNGHVSLGGQDIFKTIRSGGQWTRPENLGVPYNSTADDFFFSLKKGSNGGFFVSNRFYGRPKTSTRHEDIFEFFPRETKLFVSGKIFDTTGRDRLTDVSVGLYENVPGEEPRLLLVRVAEDGSFKIPILPDRSYSVEVSKEGYQTLLQPLESVHATAQGYDLSVSLKSVVSPKSVSAAPVLIGIPAETPVFQEKKQPPPTPPGSATGTPPVSIFKIQLEAPPKFLDSDPKYDAVRDRGTVASEPGLDASSVRVMLGDFSNKKEANDLARHLRESGLFPTAFVVRYLDGKRQ